MPTSETPTRSLPPGALRRLTRPVHILNGLSRFRGLPLRCAYLGADQVKRARWENLIFRGKVERRRAGLLPLAGAASFVKIRYPGCSLFLAEAHRLDALPLLRGRGFRIPNTVQTAIDLTAPMEEILKRSRAGFQNIRRLIAKYGLTLETSRSPGDFEDFYHRMYVPYISRRYPESGKIFDYRGLFEESTAPELFLILENRRPAAGAVVRYKDGGISLAFFGVRDGDAELLKRGVLGAAYFFVVREMKERGYDKLRLGGSPPFLKDGRTRHKIRLGARIDAGRRLDPADSVVVKILRDTPGTRGFLLQNPFLYWTAPGRLGCAFWAEAGTYSGEKFFRKDIELAFRLGIRDCTIFLYDGENAVPRKWAPNEPGRRIRFLSAGKGFPIGK